MSMANDPMSSMPMVNNNMAPMAGPSRTTTTPQSAPQQQQGTDEDEIDPKKLDAYKLIQYVFLSDMIDGAADRTMSLLLFHSYHLDNWKRNNNYCLPSSLRPTLVQRSASAF